jgi:hypothetical protein
MNQGSDKRGEEIASSRHRSRQPWLIAMTSFFEVIVFNQPLTKSTL